MKNNHDFLEDIGYRLFKIVSDNGKRNYRYNNSRKSDTWSWWGNCKPL